MTIKGKLYLIMAVTVIGIVAIGASSLIGMNFVKGKLNVLTERSTPYQLKTIELQRAVQEHTAGLMKLSAAQTRAEFGAAKAEAEKSQEGVTVLAKELASFTGAETSAGMEQLAAISKDLIAVTESRLKAEEEGQKADLLMKQKLQQISQNLRTLDASMRKVQAGSMFELSESNEGVKDITKKMRAVEAAGNALSEVKQGVLEIAAADSKTAVVIAASKFNAAMRKFTASEMVKVDPAGTKPLLEGAADVKERVTSPDGLLALKSAIASAPDDEKKKKFAQALPQTMQRLAQMSVLMGDVVEKASEDFAREGKRFDTSMSGADAASGILGVSSQLIAEGSEISRLIRELFGVRTDQELTGTKAAMDAAFKRVAALQARVAGKKASKGGTAAVSGVTASLNEVRGLLLAPNGVADTIGHLLAVKKQSAQLALKLREYVAAQREEGKKGMSSAQAEQEKAVKSVNAVFRSNIATVSILGLAVLIIGVLLSGVVLRSISKPIDELSRMAERFGSGDFSGRLDDQRKDEFGALAVHFNAATAKLSEITASLRGAITGLNSGSRDLAQASGDLSAGASSQSEESVQAASAMTEMTQTIEEVASNAQTAAAQSGNALSCATAGSEVVGRTVSGMEQIAGSVRNAARMIETLGDSSARIGNVISTINDIADQTNLLALNAAIEAARAGEAGMGFAVVADEVRKLAQQTAEATKEITVTIGQIQKDTERSVSAMREGTDLVEEGINLAHEANRSLAEIVEASTQSVAVVNQIAVAAEEQSAVAVQVSRGVEKIASITREAEEAARNISDAATNLNRLAGDLDRTASWFKA
ncbi:methyl-accepting chemotaxis protein [Geomonas subterranea]|uniref:Methyl-accepting chemotaxis protein n=1 Tax=Geomonas subterranea TaxID=2847989 RepID=A0ABX8LAZ6_9BACT|nr:methyl-accepting chemotaxis protein [Geomonas subterranea]QXE89165.1 methyl-accepting chemotaxis protein [Geomonas subterranea]QXM08718.1 methyl-accepting chemotaxis protein [Geomonas subterranea]